MTLVLAIAGLAASAWLILFQVLLAFGAPMGAMAWGGQDKGTLPAPKRIGSAVSAVLMAGFAAAFGQALDLWAIWPESVVRWVFIAGAVLFALSLVGNAASSSRIERLHGVPITVILALSCLWLAIFG